VKESKNAANQDYANAYFQSRFVDAEISDNQSFHS
jgi:hypothetical protein